MKILTRLRFNTVISLCTVILVLLSLVWSFREIIIADQKMELVDEMQKVAFDRILLRDEYLLYQKERAKIQWQAKAEAFRDLLVLADTRFDQKKDKSLLQDVRKDFDAVVFAMSGVMEGDARQDPGNNKKPAFSEAKQRLISQVFLKAYSLNDNINRLHESVQKMATNARNTGLLIIVIAITGGVIAIIVNSIVIRRTLTKRIAALGKGVEIVGAGNLDYRIAAEGNDELSALALASNEMAARLKQSYTSVENLKREVSERKKAEEAFRLLSLRYEAILASVPNIIMEVDNNKCYTWANSAGLEFFGQDVIGKEAAIYFEGQQDTYDAVQPLFNGKEELFYVESWQRRKDGEKRLLAWWCRVLKDEQGNVTGALSSAQDITELKRAEEALQESKTKLSEAQKMAQLGHWSWDVKTGVVEWSEEVYKIFHLDPRNFTPHIEAIQSLSPWPEDHERDKELIRKAMESHEKGSYEQRFLRPDGSIGYYFSTFQGKYDDGGNLISIVGTVQDITERKRTEHSLAEKEARLRILVETIPDLIWLKDADGIYLACNKMFEQFFGAKESDIVGKTDYDFVNEELADFFRDHDRKAMAAGKPSSNMEWVTFASDGHRALLNTIKAPMCDAEGKLIGVLGTGRDVTEHHKLEEQLRHSQKMEGIGTLVSGIAHDFNNILSAIIGYGHVTLMKMPQDDPHRPNIEHILESADHAAALIKNLLAFSRKQVLDRKPIDLKTVLKRMEQFLVRTIGEDVEVCIALDDIATTVFADAGQLEQVFMNLATNARDAMPRGGSFTIETAITELGDDFVTAHGYGKPGNYAMVALSDTGIGMNEETRMKLFDPFFTTKEVGKGTGLGLAMVYGIIKQHEGFINVYSEPGKGTTFRIYLPLSQDAAVDEYRPVVSEDPKGGTETILLAEDDENLRKLTTVVLEQMDYTVISANDGEEAVKKYLENKDKIQLLLFDLIMPKKSGREAYEEIKNIEPDIKIIFLTGYPAEIIRQKGLLQDTMVMLYKPISPRDLLVKVRSVLNKAGLNSRRC